MVQELRTSTVFVSSRIINTENNLKAGIYCIAGKFGLNLAVWWSILQPPDILFIVRQNLKIEGMYNNYYDPKWRPYLFYKINDQHLS